MAIFLKLRREEEWVKLKYFFLYKIFLSSHEIWSYHAWYKGVFIALGRVGLFNFLPPPSPQNNRAGKYTKGGGGDKKRPWFGGPLAPWYLY